MRLPLFLYLIDYRPKAEDVPGLGETTKVMKDLSMVLECDETRVTDKVMIDLQFLSVNVLSQRIGRRSCGRDTSGLRLYFCRVPEYVMVPSVLVVCVCVCACCGTIARPGGATSLVKHGSSNRVKTTVVVGDDLHRSSFCAPFWPLRTPCNLHQASSDDA